MPTSYAAASSAYIEQRRGNAVVQSTRTRGLDAGGLVITRDTATNSYTLSDPNPIVAYIGDSELTRPQVFSETNESRTYEREASDRLSFLTVLKALPSNPLIKLTYSSLGEWITQRVYPPSDDYDIVAEYFVFGARTDVAEVPQTGTGTYQGIAQGTWVDDTGSFALSGPATMAADFAADTISTSLSLDAVSDAGGASIDLGTATGSGTIAGNSFNGAIGFDVSNLPSSGYAGIFTGGFFGPSAVEAGYTFEMLKADTNGFMVGGVVGTKP